MFFSIAGSGVFFPERLTNEQLLEINPLGDGKGGKMRPDWAKIYFNIDERPLDLVQLPDGGWGKLPYGQGGLYGIDMGIRAARDAIAAAEIEPSDIDVLIEASATADSVGVGDHRGPYLTELGLRNNVHMISDPVGCAGFLPALYSAQAHLLTSRDPARYVLVVLTNCPSAQFATEELRRRYNQQLGHKACYLVFADGAVAFVLKRNRTSGFMNLAYKSDPSVKLIKVLTGGGINPPQPDNLHDASYYMDTANVQGVFAPFMIENWQLASDWIRSYYPGQPIGEYVFHQASKRGIDATLAQCPDIDPTKVHMIMRTFGNPAVCSGPLVLHHALTERKYESGTLIPIMLLGAGNGGAQYGAALYQV